MSNKEEPLFQGMDELEREFAPEQLPIDDPERQRVRDDTEGASETGNTYAEPVIATPIATIGTAPSGTLTPINLGVVPPAEDSDLEVDTADSDEDETPNG